MLTTFTRQVHIAYVVQEIAVNQGKIHTLFSLTFEHNVNDGAIFNGVFVCEGGQDILTTVLEEKQLVQ